MYLKRLEIHGFKSFAPKTAFEFGPGVTCIAGPNGSGKTNVAEAIRWVLGEHASRVIRARKTEDVIFSGSAKRAPIGMAEVKITLDNSDGWLPIEFSEVVVSRRAYRSGENEYYINMSRVRLRDVTDLFLKAQVGQNSYAFMGQGLVEQVLTLRPEERRGLIEEAADVRLHRDKLDLARNRLEATRENLERVDLLVREIEPRLRQLERQADRASIYTRLSTELAQALQELYGQQWREAHEQLAAARAVCDQRQKEFDDAARAVTTAEEGLASLAAAIEGRRGDITQREQAYRSIEDYLRDLRHRINVDEERRTMLTARHAELDEEARSLRREREELLPLLERQEERVRALDEQLTVAREPDAKARELEQAVAALDKARRQLTEAEARVRHASARLAEAEGQRRALHEHQARLEAELTAIERERRDQIGNLRTWAREFATRRKRIIELTPLAQRGARNLAEMRARVEELSSSAARRRHEIHALGLEIESKQARYEAVEGTDVQLPPADAAVQALLAAGGRVPGEEPSPDSRIEGLIGMVGEQIRVPAGLERAIEAALEETIHAIIVERQDDALAAIELVLSEDIGRATVFPLNDVRPSHPVNLLPERGILGVASDLVRCEPRFRPLVNALLGRTIVVETLGLAKQVIRRGLGSVVTVDGVLLKPLGSITAGSARAIRRALAHQRETGQLPSELKELRQRHRQESDALEGEERELAASRREVDGLAVEADRLRSELTQAEEMLRQHRMRLPAASARIAALRARRRDAAEALAGMAGAFAGAAGGTQQAEEQLRAAEAARDDQRSEVEAAAAHRDAVAAQAAQRTTFIQALESEQEAYRQQAAIQSASITRVERELARRAELTARAEEDLQAIAARIAATKRELEEQTRELDAAREVLEPARAELNQLESRRRALDEELAAARSASLAAERALLEAQSQVQLRNEEIDALRERLAEEGFQPSGEGEIEPVAVEEEGVPDWMAAEAARSDQPPPMRGGAGVDAAALRERITKLRAEIRSLGPVNEQAEADFSESKERYEYLTSQLGDLREAEASLLEAIDELEAIIQERFSATFQKVNGAFQRYFETFFGGGHAELTLTDTDDEGLPGIDIIAQPPRKRVRSLNMLSGGERSLTAVALLFALLHIHPSPIVVLDEVDAALDEANVGRFTAALRELAERSQFIIITHNRRTLEMADTIYGVSMGEDSTSTVLSLRLSDFSKN
jgi:chromosome segregation protein